MSHKFFLIKYYIKPLLQHVSLPLRLRPHPELQVRLPGLQLPLGPGQLSDGLWLRPQQGHGQGDGRHEEGDGPGLRGHGE